MVPNVFGDLRSAECPHGSSLQCHAWQEDFCSSAFLLHVGKIISPGLFAETNMRGSRKEGETKEEMWNKGGSPPVLHLCVHT